jgi:hypothetical protein
VENKTRYRLVAAYLQVAGYRQTLGDLEPGAARAITASGWVRYRLVERAAGGSRGGAEERLRRALYEEAPILLRSAGSEREAVLVCGAPELQTSLRLPGVTVLPRSGLLLVRGTVTEADSRKE